MDIQSKVAARRAELDRQDREAVAEARRIDKEVEKAKAKQRAAALDAIAVELTDENVAVVRDGAGLVLQDCTIPPLDVGALKKHQIEELLTREARKLWTPGENWQVIGLITAGVCLIFMPLFTIVFVCGGLARRSSLNQRYKTIVRSRYPQIFEEPSTKLDVVQDLLT